MIGTQTSSRLPSFRRISFRSQVGQNRDVQTTGADRLTAKLHVTGPEPASVFLFGFQFGSFTLISLWRRETRDTLTAPVDVLVVVSAELRAPFPAGMWHTGSGRGR